jgi:EAL domain-containing protein (putative c-di-GMP-specific phosphodiesterase class I)
MRNAAIAVDQVLPSHSEGSCFFDLSMERRLLREEQIERDLRACIQDQAVADVFLVFQPIIEVKTERIVGFEALARMKSLELGVVSPLEFIAVAEKTQLIVPLGRRITRQACQFLARLNQNGHSDLKVSINISAVQLLRDDFVSDLLLIIAETGVQAARIWIEITESIFADNYGIINDKLQILSEHGIQVAIDDFGTGYSSLARERELNVSCLKIDKYFIDKLSELEPEQALTGDIISMAHRLGHIVIAEGVELECQKAYLIEHACDLMQGYLFSRPLPADEAITRLQ